MFSKNNNLIGYTTVIVIFSIYFLGIFTGIKYTETKFKNAGKELWENLENKKQFQQCLTQQLFKIEELKESICGQ